VRKPLDSFIDDDQLELINLLDKLCIKYLIEKNTIEFEFIKVEFINKKASNIIFINPGCPGSPPKIDDEKMKQVCCLLRKFYDNIRRFV
jgi:hypothetical protein